MCYYEYIIFLTKGVVNLFQIFILFLFILYLICEMSKYNYGNFFNFVVKKKLYYNKKIVFIKLLLISACSIMLIINRFLPGSIYEQSSGFRSFFVFLAILSLLVLHSIRDLIKARNQREEKISE